VEKWWRGTKKDCGVTPAVSYRSTVNESTAGQLGDLGFLEGSLGNIGCCIADSLKLGVEWALLVFFAEWSLTTDWSVDCFNDVEKIDIFWLLGKTLTAVRTLHGLKNANRNEGLENLEQEALGDSSFLGNRVGSDWLLTVFVLELSHVDNSVNGVAGSARQFHLESS
jgi:hypothetical protein